MLKVSVISPEAVLFEGETDSVALDVVQQRRQAQVVLAEVSDVGVDVGSCALHVDQGLDREAVSQVVVVPTSAQLRLCRPPDYADPGCSNGPTRTGASG